MKLIYAKLWLKKWIKYNHDDLDENKLNRAIINLSHRVYKSYGLKGHNTRQKIRQILKDYSKIELANYGVAFQRPLRIQYKNRYPRITVHRATRGIGYFLLSLLKVAAFIVLVLIILYIISHFW